MSKLLSPHTILEGDLLAPLSTPDLSRRRTLQLEREASDFARTSAQMRGIEKNREFLQSDLRGPVSSRNTIPKYPDAELDRLEFFADRLLRANARKQAKPEIVDRNIRRTLNELRLNAPQRSTSDTKRFDTAFVFTNRGYDYPRTVFGTDAWTRSSYDMRKKFITKVLALPCVERSVRREVMFAKGKSAKGYRVKHRMGKFADIWC